MSPVRFFPTDSEGILSDLVSDRTNVFFGIADTREWTDDVNGEPNNPLTHSWTFDISSATSPLTLSIDLGQCSDGNSFDGITEGLLQFEYSIDGGAFQTAFLCQPFDASASGFAYRAMDSGTLPGVVNVLQCTGANTVTKISAETGSAAADTFLDKCPPSGATGEGTLDTFMTELTGTGSTLEIRLTTHVAFEAMAFDNIVVTTAGGGGPVTVAPTEITTTRGDFIEGDLPEISSSDNSDYRIQRSNSDIQSRTEFEVKAVSPTASPVSLAVTLEGSVFARSNVVQTIELFKLSRRPVRHRRHPECQPFPLTGLGRYRFPGWCVRRLH